MKNEQAANGGTKPIGGCNVGHSGCCDSSASSNDSTSHEVTDPGILQSPPDGDSSGKDQQ